MTGSPNPFGFVIHHIFPREAYRDADLRAAFRDAGIHLDARGNKVALANNPETAKLFASDPSYAAAGFGSSAHFGGHSAYNNFLIDQARDILDRPPNSDGTLTASQKADLAGLHKFATDVSFGRIDGAGVTSDYADLSRAYDTDTYKNAPDTEKLAHLDPANFDTTLTDEGSNSNAQERADRVDVLVDEAEARGSLTSEQADAARARIDGSSNPVDADGNPSTPENRVSSAGITVTVDIANNNGQSALVSDINGIQSEAAERGLGYNTTRNVARDFAMNEDGSINFSALSDGLDRVVDAARGALADPALLDRGLDAIKSGVAAGAGGFVADFAEVLSSDETRALLTNALETGDFGDVTQHLGQEMLEAVVFGAATAVAVGAIAAIPVVGVPVATAIGVGMVAYGAYEIATGAYAYMQDDAFQAALSSYLDGAWVGAAVDVASAFFSAPYGAAALAALPLGAAGIVLTGLAALFDNPPPSPLVLDLDSDGIELTALDGSSAYFDLTIDGFAERTGWVSVDDGLLALDVDGDGRIDDGSELFGDQTGHAHGFLALAEHDLAANGGNGDGMIDASDAVYADLLIWQDANGDGVSQAGELRGLADMGVASISLGAVATDYEVAGNSILWEAGFTWSDGTTGTVGDAFFATDEIDTVATLPDTFQYDPEVFKLPLLGGMGHLASTAVAMTTDDALRAQATALVMQAASGDVADFRAAFEDYVLNWAGLPGWNSSNITEVLNSLISFSDRSKFIEPYKLAFIETVLGREFHSGDDAFYGNAVGPVVANLLETGYDKLMDALAAQFLSQVPVSHALLTSSDADGYEAALEGSPLAGLASGDMDWIADVVADALSAAEGTRSLSEAAELLRMMRYAASDPVAYDQAIEDAWSAAGGDAVEGAAFVAGLLSASGVEIWDTAGDDTLQGGAGDDVIHGTTGDDTYVWGSGMGNDVLDEEGSTSDVDRLVLTNLNFEDVRFVRVEGSGFEADLVIEVIETGERLILDDQGSTTTLDQIELVEFADGTVINTTQMYANTRFWVDGSDEAETITAQSNTFTVNGSNLHIGGGVTGGLGNDTITGSVHGDLFTYRAGDGSDTIIDNDDSGTHTTDRLRFADLQADNVRFFHTAIGDLEITVPDGSTITVRDHFGDHRTDLEVVEFADGTSLTWLGIRNKAVADTKASGYVRGSRDGEHFRHAEGDGSYTIEAGDDRGTHLTDRLIFTDLTIADLTFAHVSDGDLRITTTGGDVITVLDHFDGYDHDMEVIEFADGTTFNLADIRNKVVADAKGSGTVTGTKWSERYEHAEGDGSYTIHETSGSNTATDRLLFSDLDADGVRFSHTSGGDLLITTAGGDVVTIADHFSNRDHAIEYIDFGDGTVLNASDIRAKAMADMKASGFVRGTKSSDRYEHAEGDGSYTILETNGYGYASAMDRLSFTDLDPDRVTFSHTSGGDLLITTAGGDVITVTDHFADRDNAIESIAFADGSTITASAIRTKAMNDMKVSGVVRGTAHGERYEHAEGDGSYTILETESYGYGDSKDRLVFTDLDVDDVTFEKMSNGNLRLTTTGGDVITVRDHFDNSKSDMDYIEFADGTVLDIHGIENRLYIGGNGDDTITGSSTGNVLDGGAGNDLLDGANGDDDLFGGDGDDTLDGGNGDDEHVGGAGDDLVRGSLGADTFDGGAGDDTISFAYSGSDVDIDLAAGTAVFASGATEQVIAFEAADGSSGANVLTGTDGTNVLRGLAGDDTLAAGGGDDVLDGGSGDDTLDGGTGDDVLTGGTGADRFVFATGNGHDVVQDFDRTIDILEIDGDVFDGSGTVAGVDAVQDGADVVLTYGNGDTITLRGVNLDNWDGVGEATSDSITGTSGADTLVGGGGDDTLEGGDGRDLYLYTLGDGSDTIQEADNTTYRYNWNPYTHRDIDRLVFTDLVADDVVFSDGGGGDLRITMSDGATITVVDHNQHWSERIDEIEFADGTVLDFDAVTQKYVSDQMTDGADLVSGTTQANTLEGGLGDDTLEGGDGRDTYVYALGDGSDTIQEQDNTTYRTNYNPYSHRDIDRLVFIDLDADDVVFSDGGGGDLRITMSDGATITVIDHNRHWSERIDEIEFANGDVFDFEAITAKYVSDQATDGADLVMGTAQSNVLEGGLGNDTLEGGDGRDTYLYALGDGSDRIQETDNTTHRYNFNPYTHRDLDRLVFSDLDADELVFSEGSGGDLVITMSDGAAITVTDHFERWAERMDEIEFSDGTVIDFAGIQQKVDDDALLI